jgi:hypothetical protein
LGAAVRAGGVAAVVLWGAGARAVAGGLGAEAAGSAETRAVLDGTGGIPVADATGGAWGRWGDADAVTATTGGATRALAVG